MGWLDGPRDRLFPRVAAAIARSKIAPAPGRSGLVNTAEFGEVSAVVSPSVDVGRIPESYGDVEAG